jgi:hypothetical protein
MPIRFNIIVPGCHTTPKPHAPASLTYARARDSRSNESGSGPGPGRLYRYRCVSGSGRGLWVMERAGEVIGGLSRAAGGGYATVG